MKKMNYIFDLGNVLLTYQPRAYMMNMFDGDTELVDALFDLIFASEEWVMMDRGLISRVDAFERYKNKRPDLRAQIEDVQQHIPDIFDTIPETVQLLGELKARGEKLYFLSNFQDELIGEVNAMYDFFKHFDGGVYSCDVKCSKPDPRIYQMLLDNYNLKPETCRFFDDMPENIEGAKAMGFEGVVVSCPKDVADNV